MFCPEEKIQKKVLDQFLKKRTGMRGKMEGKRFFLRKNEREKFFLRKNGRERFFLRKK